jgi:cytochrome P450
MSVYPEVQKKAQEEIDRVIGSDRLPVNADKPNLPYIEAVMKETHRWHPVAPLGVAHASKNEDEYSGYRIPGGAIMVPNIWFVTLFILYNTMLTDHQGLRS